MRDDFTQATKELLARRVNYLCSNPECKLCTVGPHNDTARTVSKGVAAHITAAAPGGRRYDATLTPEQRQSPENGIWLCQNCAKLIDSDDTRFTVASLREWKTQSESSIRHSIESNSPISNAPVDRDLRIRASYVGGLQKSHVHLGVFNAGTAPLYLVSWFARWGEKNCFSSTGCIRGQLPFRLQEQDRLNLVIDLGAQSVNGLTMIGLVDGLGKWWNTSDSEIASIVQQATRYQSLVTKSDNSAMRSKMRHCDVDIRAAVRDGPTGQKRIEIDFTNNSDVPIRLIGARIGWRYDPPRATPGGTVPGPEVAELGGNVNLSCANSLKEPIPSQGSISFYVHESIAGVLVETLFDDVKDNDFEVDVFTDVDTKWTATGNGIPEAVRDFARMIVDSTR